MSRPQDLVAPAQLCLFSMGDQTAAPGLSADSQALYFDKGRLSWGLGNLRPLPLMPLDSFLVLGHFASFPCEPVTLGEGCGC